MLDYEDIARRYTRTRTINLELNSALPGLLSNETIQQAARQLGIWVQGTIVFRDMDQSGVLMDFAIHDCRVDGQNAVDRYLALYPPTPHSEQETILAVMQRGYYSVFQVEAVVPGVGIHVHDLFQEQRHFLADMGFSQTAVKGFVIATRVFAFADFLMTGGAALPVGPTAMEQIFQLELLLKNQDVATMAPQRRADFNATIISLCLSDQEAPDIRYQGIGEGEMEETGEVLPSRRPGRNDPCPCGSGKKYKKCCGR